MSFIRKVRGTLLVRTINPWAASKFGTNSKRYWDARLSHSWDQVGGDDQTREFAMGMQRNIRELSIQDVNSVLDYGCATGDSIPVLRQIFPSARIYVHDLSDTGVAKALKKYSSFSPKRWSEDIDVDFIYCSNVIEHVPDPTRFMADLTESSSNYILVQCPWEEFGPDGKKLTPEKHQGEHVWTVDEHFIREHFPVSNWSWKGYLDDVPNAWPFGKQLFIVGTKLGKGQEGSIAITPAQP